MGAKKEEFCYCQTKLSRDPEVGSWNSLHRSWSGFIAFSKSWFFFQIAYYFYVIEVANCGTCHCGMTISKVMNIPAQSGPVLPKGVNCYQSHSWCSLVLGTLWIIPFASLDALVHPGRHHYAGAEGVSWINSEIHCWKFCSLSCQCLLMGGSLWKLYLSLVMPKTTWPFFNKIVIPEKNLNTVFIFILQQQMAKKIVSFLKTESHFWPKTKNVKFYAKG